MSPVLLLCLAWAFESAEAVPFAEVPSLSMPLSAASVPLMATSVPSFVVSAVWPAPNAEPVAVVLPVSMTPKSVIVAGSTKLGKSVGSLYSGEDGETPASVDFVWCPFVDAPSLAMYSVLQPKEGCSHASPVLVAVSPLLVAVSLEWGAVSPVGVAVLVVGVFES